MGGQFTHRIEIFTADLALSGSYLLQHYRRLSDALNGDQRRFIPLRDATIGALGQETHIQRVPNLLFDRSKAIVVSSLAEAAAPADYSRAEQLREMLPTAVMCFTETFVVRGTLYRRPNLELVDMLERLDDDFLPLRRAQVFGLRGDIRSVEREFALLARARIVALYQLTEPDAAT